MRKTLVTAPTKEAVSLNEAKNFCRIECDEDNNLLKKLITSARQYCESYTKRRYESQTWSLTLDRAEIEKCMQLEVFDVDSVTSVKGYDPDNVETTFVSGTDYEVFNNRLVLDISGASFRTYDSMVIEYSVGATETPRAIKDAINMLVLHWYENREAVVVGTASDLVHGEVLALLGSEIIYTA